MTKNAAALACTLVLSACISNTTTYIPTSARMDVRTAQQEVKGLLMSRGEMKTAEGRIKVNDIRFRSDGMAFLMQQGHFTWAVTHDWNFDSASVQTCYFAGMDTPSVQHRRDGMVNDYGVTMCRITAYFSSASDAQRLADALYVLKVSAR